MFFLKESHTFRDPKVSKLGSMLDLVLGGVLEASWIDLERVFGGQDAPKTAQDGGKTAHDGAKTAQDGAKIGRVDTKTRQDDAKTFQDGAKIG